MPYAGLRLWRRNRGYWDIRKELKNGSERMCVSDVGVRISPYKASGEEAECVQ